MLEFLLPIASSLGTYGAKKMFGKDSNEAELASGLAEIGSQTIPHMASVSERKGRAVARFNKHAYPNTTTSEQLGSGSAVAAQNTGANIQAQKAMQAREHKNKIELEKMKARASAVTATAPHGKRVMENAIAAVEGGQVETYNTLMQAKMEAVPSEIARNKAGARKDIAQAALTYEQAAQTQDARQIDKAKLQFAKEIAQNAAYGENGFIVAAIMKMLSGEKLTEEEKNDSFLIASMKALKRFGFIK